MKPDCRTPSDNPPSTAELPADHGLGPAFAVADLPAPPPFSLKNLFRIIGPGAILLATSIGGGEWLVGPAHATKHGASLLWIVTVAIGFQLVFNLQAIRYTLYTGEPIYGGILRLWPGPKFWGVFYCLLAFLQLAWPALALSCANTLFGLYFHRLPEDANSVEAIAQAQLNARWIAVGVIVVVLGILHFGGTVERMLEKASWCMLVLIFSFLVVVNVWFVPVDVWIHNLRGFFGLVPASGGEIDWALLGALAATAGTGGIGNLTITNWMRDKGFGMGALTGAIPSAIGSREIKLSPFGKVFKASGQNLASWKQWCRYVFADQVLVWALFCFIGMFLNVNLATHIMGGKSMEGLSAGAYQAQELARIAWSGFWYITLLNGFWILFSTQLGNTDILVRTITDVLWLASSRVRNWRGGDVRGVYYGLLFVASSFGIATLWWSGAMSLFKLLANMAGLVLALASFQVIRVNRRFLPGALRPRLMSEILLVACGLFYSFFTVRWLWTLVTGALSWLQGEAA